MMLLGLSSYFIALFFTFAVSLFSNVYKMASSIQDLTFSDFQVKMKNERKERVFLYNTGRDALSLPPDDSIYVMCSALKQSLWQK